MKFDIDVQPRASWARPLRFTWDSEAGTVEGSDAEAVMRLIREALMVGAVQARPKRRWISVYDPLHNPVEMALVIGQFHELCLTLAAYYPID